MDLQLGGKTALVTGSSSGIGTSIARMLADEGVAVAVHGRDKDRADSVADDIRCGGGKAVVALGDLSGDDGAAAVAEAVERQLGTIDILVNNAGGRVDTGNPLWFDVTLTDWIATYEQNLGAVVRMCHHFVPGMKARGWGRVINIGSASSTQPIPTLPEYQGAKAAINNLTVSLSHALAHTGITVNTVSPGTVLTATVETWLRTVAEQMQWGDDFSEIERRFTTEMLPLTVSHVGTPEDVAALVALVASPRGGYINGANLRIDGGQNLSTN